MKRKLLLLKLYILAILGKNMKKSEIIEKSGVFAEFGGGYWHPN